MKSVDGRMLMKKDAGRKRCGDYFEIDEWRVRRLRLLQLERNVLES